MLVLKLCQKSCPELIPVTLTDKLGDGADGEVFSFIEDGNKVIKLSIIYEELGVSLARSFDYINELLGYLISRPSPAYARVYEHKYMIESARQVFGNQDQKYIIHYYIMEKLQKISEDERKVFHSILSHEDTVNQKNFSIEKIKKMLVGLARGLDFSQEKVIFFVNNLRSTPIRHLDIHPRNIMADSAGNFKLIDFDRAELDLSINSYEGDSNVNVA